jgi:hypothetical protein
LPLTVVAQPNRGRFHSVRTGIRHASGEYVLVLGARVRLRPEALAFVRGRQTEGELVWTGHVHIHASANPYGTFQNVLTEIAWRDYFDNPRATSFGAKDFDRYPKGSGCFVAPRDIWLEAFDPIPGRFSDVRHANDDTPMLRRIAAARPIHVAPAFAADYEPRGTMRTFIKHSVHRGTVFFDGHGRRESRFFPLIVASFPLTAGIALASRARPRLVPMVAAATSVAAGVTAAAARRPRREVATVAGLAPVWSGAFTIGLWRGLAMLVAHRVRRVLSRVAEREGSDG